MPVMEQIWTSFLCTFIFLVVPGESVAVPKVFVSVSFNTPWSQVCHFDDLFQTRLAELIIEPNGDYAYKRLSPSRIKFINVAKECSELNEQKRYEEGDLEFYISAKDEDSLVDKELTIKAFTVLHDYWVNHKMSEMDPYFIGKVTNVDLLGKGAPFVPEAFTEGERSWIGVGAGTAFIFLIALIVLIKRQYKVITTKPAKSLRYIQNLQASTNAYEDPQSFAMETHSLATMGIVELALREKSDSIKNEEFQSLDNNMPSEDLYSPNTASKNRSPHVLPVFGTRVELPGSEPYINANFVRDHKGESRYIATQHPLEETVEDFWRMVLDRHASVVVMVNEEQEINPSECKDYFPSDEEVTENSGDIAVTVKRIIKNSDYVLTTLAVVDCKTDSTPRDVTHFRFIGWENRNMPTVSSFLTFVGAIREFKMEHVDSRDTPTIVHCSNGQRFTGVYIAVDIGIQSNEENGTSLIDVFELSKKLRQDRNGIISTIEYYNYIYQVLYEHVVNGGEVKDARL